MIKKDTKGNYRTKNAITKIKNVLDEVNNRVEMKQDRIIDFEDRKIKSTSSEKQNIEWKK